MKKTYDTFPPEQTVTALAHFAWCALVALRTAQQDGQALSPPGAHIFLLRWLAVAQKQRRFPRPVAADTDRLLRLGRSKGLAADIEQRLNSLWQSCSDALSQQSDLYRLTRVIEYLKSRGWVNAVVSDDEWQPAALYAEYPSVPALLVRKSELLRNFTDRGEQSAPVDFIVVGDGDIIGRALDERGLQYTVRDEPPDGYLFTLLPSGEPAGHGKTQTP